jgi:hypothetical protein
LVKKIMLILKNYLKYSTKFLQKWNCLSDGLNRLAFMVFIKYKTLFEELYSKKELNEFKQKYDQIRQQSGSISWSEG